MSSFEVKGVVKDVLGIEEVGNNGTQKNTVIVTVEDNGYSNDLAIDFMKDKAKTVDEKVSIGDEIEIHFNIRSNQAQNGRWFTNANGWKFTVLGGGQNRNNDLPY